MRVVFDTNIFISALVIPGSQAEKAIFKIIEGSDILIISREIIKEVLSVLSAKFSSDIEEISRVAISLADIAELVKPTEKIKVLKDDPDNRVLECAVCGNAEILVTGDKEMLRLEGYRGIKIITLKEYLKN